jgi:hypothetical protein
MSIGTEMVRTPRRLPGSGLWSSEGDAPDPTPWRATKTTRPRASPTPAKANGQREGSPSARDVMTKDRAVEAFEPG